MFKTARAVWQQRQIAKVIVLGAITVVLFSVTLLLMRGFRGYQGAVAQESFRRAEFEMARGKPLDAIGRYRTALLYSRDNPNYRLRLGEALVAAHHDQEALAYLKTLWERAPGNGNVNLQLARLSERMGDHRAAVEYFHNAFYGAWDEEPETHRRDARFELIEVLLRGRQGRAADAELESLLPDLPNDPAVEMWAANLFLQAGNSLRALNLFERVLRERPSDPDALTGAGRAAFELGSFGKAADYLHRGINGKNEPELTELLQVAKTVNGLDPYQRRLTLRQRNERIISAYLQAGERIQKCLESAVGAPPQQVSQIYSQWSSMSSRASAPALRRAPESADDVLKIALQAEEIAAGECGNGDVEDRALVLIAKEHEGAAR